MLPEGCCVEQVSMLCATIRKRLSYKREFFLNNFGNKDYHGTGADASENVDHPATDVTVDQPKRLEVFHK